ncbi:MAG: hypothetical protein Q4A82_05035 [Corynebacterium sp.]|nr:hypothetical protein [Corynebacterium sp.]
MDSSSHETVVTLWFVTATQPEKVIATMPRADRGFGRKLLSQLNPRWPITPIGQFALNRSAQPSRSEFYIAGFPGLSIIQTVVDDITTISSIDPALRTVIPATDVYVCATNTGTSYGAFAHWSNGNLKRAFSAVDEKVYEDLGLVETFESSYWAGYHATETSGIALPFSPIDLALHAQRSWLGFDMATCPDINIVAYAIDGRPEPKITYRQPVDVGTLAERSSAKLSLGATRSEFDDYERIDEFDDVDGSSKYAEEAVALTKKSVTKTKSLASRFRERLARFGGDFKERLRHTDRPAPIKPADNKADKANEKTTEPADATTEASVTEASATEKTAKTANTTKTKDTKAAAKPEATTPKAAKPTETAPAKKKKAPASKSSEASGIPEESGASETPKTPKPSDTPTPETVSMEAITTADAIGVEAVTTPAKESTDTKVIDSTAVKAGAKKAKEQEKQAKKTKAQAAKPAAKPAPKQTTPETASFAASDVTPQSTGTTQKPAAQQPTPQPQTQQPKQSQEKSQPPETKAFPADTTTRTVTSPKAPETPTKPAAETAPKAPVKTPTEAPAPKESKEPAEPTEAPKKKRRGFGRRSRTKK